MTAETSKHHRTGSEWPILHDISPPISAGMQVYPGDVPPTRTVQSDIARGDVVTTSAIFTTVHAGAHLDASSHYSAGGASIDLCDLQRCVGHCQVVRVPARRGQALAPADVEAPIVAPRVLIATGTWPDPARFNADYAALSAELVEFLHGRGVVLVGVDVPSVDLFAAGDLPAHGACLRTGMTILEGLQLAAVPAGEYELIALPLRLVGFEASPVRAVLRAWPV